MNLAFLWEQKLMICSRKGILCGYTYYNPKVHLHQCKGEQIKDYTGCGHGNQCAVGYGMLHTDKSCHKRRPRVIKKSHRSRYCRPRVRRAPRRKQRV